MSELKYNTGQDILCVCSKCKMVLNHLIASAYDGEPIHVICYTCKTKHKYSFKKNPGYKKSFNDTTVKKRKKKPTVEEKTGLKFDWNLVSKEEKSYSIKGKFEINDTIAHPKFGVGVVQQEDKYTISVLFNDGSKKLVHNK